MTDSSLSQRPGRGLGWGLLVLALLSVLIPVKPSMASNAPERLVDKSRITLEALLEDPEMPELRDFIKDARAVLIFPQLIKGGFIIGGEGGNGVFLVKDKNGSWSPPAFYSLAAGSIGLQIGGQVSEVVFTVMNEDAVEAVLNTQFKLGADLSVAVGPIGKGVEASTTTALGLDLYAFSRTAGLYGGGAFEGAAILKRETLNTEYYGADVGPRQIVIDRKFSNPQADMLRRALPD